MSRISGNQTAYLSRSLEVTHGPCVHFSPCFPGEPFTARFVCDDPVLQSAVKQRCFGAKVQTCSAWVLCMCTHEHGSNVTCWNSSCVQGQISDVLLTLRININLYKGHVLLIWFETKFSGKNVFSVILPMSCMCLALLLLNRLYLRKTRSNLPELPNYCKK